MQGHYARGEREAGCLCARAARPKDLQLQLAALGYVGEAVLGAEPSAILAAITANQGDPLWERARWGKARGGGGYVTFQLRRGMLHHMVLMSQATLATLLPGHTV
jgi:hypothetical protein